MYCRDVFFSIAKYLTNEKETFLSLRATCAAAKRACDIIISAYRNEMLYIEYDGWDKWTLYRLKDIEHLKRNINGTWDIIDNANLRGVPATYSANTWNRPSGFLIKGIDILEKEFIKGKCCPDSYGCQWLFNDI